MSHYYCNIVGCPEKAVSTLLRIELDLFYKVHVCKTHEQILKAPN